MRSGASYGHIPVKAVPKSGARLTVAQVTEIKANTERNTDLARRYGVNESTIRGIRAGRSWAHVAPAPRAALARAA